ncbi:MAG: signal peptide peptidase SppA [Elusimicrobia bacterium]|nr:signal peptide peptidase SppA [Elusimicrobiota bacterium]
MDNWEQNPQQEPQPETSGPSPEIPAPKSRAAAWPALLGLLYAASLAAALILVFSGPRPKVADSESQKPEGLKQKFGILDFDKKDAIGIIRLDGVIRMDRQGGFWNETMVDRIKKNLERMAKKKQIKAIILRINSPGGTVASSQELYQAIKYLRMKHNKPVIALLGDVAASGGYYVASACDRIVSEPGTITGSIGVIFQTGHFDGLIKKYGVNFNTIKSGPYKDIGNPFRPMEADERKILQSMIDGAYEQFVQAVSEGRKIPPLEVKKSADGRIFLGSQARAAQLVDQDSGYKGAIDLAKEMGKITGEPKIIWDGDFKEDFLEEILKGSSPTGIWKWVAPEAALPPTGLLYLWTGY